MSLSNKLSNGLATQNRQRTWQGFMRFWPLVALSMMAMWFVRVNPGLEVSPLDSGLADLASAQQQAHEADKLCLLYFATSYCFPCDQRENMFRKNTALQEALNTGYVPFRIDPLRDEASAALAHTYGIDSLPAFVITSAEGKEIRRFSSLLNPYQMTNQLERAYLLQEVPSPLLASQAEISLAKQSPSISRQQQKLIYGLAYPETGKRAELLSAAKIISQEWSQGVWIQAGSPEGEAVVVIGAFDSKKEALVTQTLLRSWQNKETELIVLQATPIPLYSWETANAALPASETKETQP